MREGESGEDGVGELGGLEEGIVFEEMTFDGGEVGGGVGCCE